MLKNVYTSLSGALSQEKAFEIISNNLANINTTGFKEETLTFKLLDPQAEKNYKEPVPAANYKVSLEDVLPLRGNDMKYVGISGVSRNEEQGSPIQTNNPLDIMVEGKGYFTVNTSNGLRYTRNGALTLNSDGVLSDKFGNPVLGTQGNIFLANSKVEINNKGEIYQQGEFVDRVLLYEFDKDHFLEKVGNNHYFFHGPDEARKEISNATIHQGALESSNVNAVKNLTNMILAHRSYEAYQKAIKSYDSMMEKSNNKLGRLEG